MAAIIAAIFALIAYWQSSGLPSLEPEISFLPFNSATAPFTATFRPPPPWVATDVAPFDSGLIADTLPILDRISSDTICTVVLKNTTKYAARNPGVRISFDGLLYNVPPVGWTSVERWGEKNGQKAIQWDGGTENIVHGKWSRTLPILGFNEVVVTTGEPALIITVVADGCSPKDFRFPLDVSMTSVNAL